VLQVVNVSHQYGPQTVLTQVNLQLTTHSRVGLVGRNGEGKTTLLNLIMGEITPTEGNITLTPGTQINRLTQHPRIAPGNTLKEELDSAFTALNNAIAEEIRLRNLLDAECTEPERLAWLSELTTVIALQQHLGVNDRDARVNRMIQGLGFSLEQLSTPVEQFSGGWQMRINLAKVLLQGADILLLDEPTNHLDMAACEWLEQFLRSYPGGLLIVSHDRQFLDALITEVAELDRGQITLWPGNYTRYKQLKQEAVDRQTAAAQRQEKYIAEQMAFVNRFRASATKSTQAKSREKQLARLERIEAPQREQGSMYLAFSVGKPSSRDVLTLKDISKTYGNRALYRNLNATVERGHRVFILGENGCGKTTLLRLIMGTETPDSGSILWGNQVTQGYYAQHHLDSLDPSLTAYDTLLQVVDGKGESHIRGMLGALLFRNEEVFKPVSVLSGGEKSRLALAKLLTTGPNTLFLDEPTNHLDIPSQEVVENALAGYNGTMICISHDRQFIHRLATHIWEIVDGQLITFDGSYDAYLTKRAQLIRHLQPVNGSKPTVNSSVVPVEASSAQSSPLQTRKQMEKQLKQLEKAILAKDKEKQTLQQSLAAPTQDYAQLGEITKQLQATEAVIADLETQWEVLSEQLV
jgi:ATP-binding cassette, subfamily F, member 3